MWRAKYTRRAPAVEPRRVAAHLSRAPGLTDAPGSECGMEGDTPVAGDQPARLQERQCARQCGRGEMAARSELLDGPASLDECSKDQSFRLGQGRDHVTGRG